MNKNILDNITRISEYYNTVDLTVCTSGRQFSIVKVEGPMAQSFHVLQYVTHGKGTLELNGKKYPVYKGDMFFLPENTNCCYYGDPIDPYSYYWVSIKGKYANYLLRKCNITEENPVCHLQDRKIEKLFCNIFQNMRRNNLATSLQVLSYLYELFAILAKKYTEENPNELHYLIEKALAYMEGHFQERITITTLCEYLSCDRAHFTKLFKKQLSVSPKEYLLQLRLSHSRTLLKETQKTIEQIATECGMEHAAFSAIFKQRYGISPNNYRKRKKQNPKNQEVIHRI